jgi:hypothetical protein
MQRSAIGIAWSRLHGCNFLKINRRLSPQCQSIKLLPFLLEAEHIALLCQLSMLCLPDDSLPSCARPCLFDPDNGTSVLPYDHLPWNTTDCLPRLIAKAVGSLYLTVYHLLVIAKHLAYRSQENIKSKQIESTGEEEAKYTQQACRLHHNL